MKRVERGPQQRLQQSHASYTTRWTRMSKNNYTLTQLAELLTHAKLAEGFSLKTNDWYCMAIHQYGDWLQQQGLSPTLEYFTLARVREYIVYLQQRPALPNKTRVFVPGRTLSDQTVNNHARALRAFSNWLFQERYTDEPQLERLKMPKTSKRVQDVLTPEEIAKIIAVLDYRTENGARDLAIFLLMLDTGIRAGELCGLRLEDLKLEEGYALVFGKGKKQRPVKIGAQVAKVIRFYFLHWRQTTSPAVSTVFVTCKGVRSDDQAPLAASGGHALSVNALGQLMRRLGRHAGVPRLHPHLLRHTFACLHLEQHHDPFALKSLLGHTTLAMTNHYCEAVSQAKYVREAKVSVVDRLQFGAVNLRGRPRGTAKRQG